MIFLKGVEALQSLTDLRASCNHLGNAKEVEHLPLLTSIDLHSNSINSVCLIFHLDFVIFNI